MAIFLTQTELNLMKRDFIQAVRSEIGTCIKITYKLPVNPTVDKVYNIIESDEWKEKTLSPRGMQQILSPKHTEILSFGILSAGDCLLFIPANFDLTEVPANYKAVHIEAGGQFWIPVGEKMDSFHRYAIMTFAFNEHIAQVIPCKLDKTNGL